MEDEPIKASIIRCQSEARRYGAMRSCGRCTRGRHAGCNRFYEAGVAVVRTAHNQERFGLLQVTCAVCVRACARSF
jgi:hypothetical protein